MRDADRDEDQEQAVRLHVPLDLAEYVRRRVRDAPDVLLEGAHEHEEHLDAERYQHPPLEIPDDTQRDPDEREHHLVRPRIDDVAQVRLPHEMHPLPETKRALGVDAHLLKVEEHLLKEGELAVDEIGEPRGPAENEDWQHDPPGETDEDGDHQQPTEHHRTHHAEDAEHVGSDTR